MSAVQPVVGTGQAEDDTRSRKFFKQDDLRRRMAYRDRVQHDRARALHLYMDPAQQFLRSMSIPRSHHGPTIGSESVERPKTLNDLERAREDYYHWVEYCEEYLVTEFTYGFETLYWTWSKYADYEMIQIPRENLTKKWVRRWRYSHVDLASAFLHHNQEQNVTVTAPDGHTVSANQDELMLSGSHTETRWTTLAHLAQRHVLRTLLIDRGELEQWLNQKAKFDKLRIHVPAVLDSFHRTHLQETWKQIIHIRFDARADAAHYHPLSRPEVSQVHHRTIGSQGILRQIHDQFFEHLIRRRYSVVEWRGVDRRAGDKWAANWAAEIEYKIASDLRTIVQEAADKKPENAYEDLANHTIEYLLQKYSVETSSKVKLDSWQRYLQNNIYTYEWREIETDTHDELLEKLQDLEQMYEPEETSDPEELTPPFGPFPAIEVDFVYHATRQAMLGATQVHSKPNDDYHGEHLKHHTLLAWEQYRSEELGKTLEEAQEMCAAPREHSTTMDPPRSRTQLPFARSQPASHRERVDVKTLEELSNKATEIARHLLQPPQDHDQAHAQGHHETRNQRADEKHQAHQHVASHSSSTHSLSPGRLHPEAHTGSAHSGLTPPGADPRTNQHVLPKRPATSRSPSPTAKKQQGAQG